MAPCGSLWTFWILIDLYVSLWIHMDPYESFLMHPYGSSWILMCPVGSLWILMVSYGSLWKNLSEMVPKSPQNLSKIDLRGGLGATWSAYGYFLRAYGSE